MPPPSPTCHGHGNPSPFQGVREFFTYRFLCPFHCFKICRVIFPPRLQFKMTSGRCCSMHCRTEGVGCGIRGEDATIPLLKPHAVKAIYHTE